MDARMTAVHYWGMGWTPSSTRREATAAMLLATPFITSALVGDQSTVSTAEYPDYFWTPFWPARVDIVLGVAFGVVFAVAAFGVLRRRHESPWTRNQTLALALRMAVGVVCGYAYRVFTAGVIGANIGAGMIVMFGVPLVVVLMVAAAVIARRD
jgi:hypothetical protein